MSRYRNFEPSSRALVVALLLAPPIASFIITFFMYLVILMVNAESRAAESLFDFFGPFLFLWAMVFAIGLAATLLFAVPLSRLLSFFGCLNFRSMALAGAVSGGATLCYFFWGDIVVAKPTSYRSILFISMLGAFAGAVHLFVFTHICERLTRRFSSPRIDNPPETE